MEGKGTYGIVYSNPRFPFFMKYNFLLEEINNDDESIENLNNKNEVSKIFFYYEDYLFEKNNYILLCKYNLPDIYFNKPIHFGFIDKENVINSITYTYDWSGYKYDFKKIILNVPFQITFPKGKNIFTNYELKIEDFYKKSLNMIYCIKYLNDNDFIFDDFKISNIIEVDEIYKVCDFSSILYINDLKVKYKETCLYSYFYYIYSPILNQTLIYFLKNGDYEYQEIYDEDYYYNYKYIKNIIYQLYITFKKYSLDIDFIEIIENKTIKISILNIFKLLIKFRKEKNNNKYFFKKFIEYLNSKYKDDNYKKIQDIIQRINLHSLGMYFLSIFNEKNNFLDLFCFENSLQVKILILSIRLILNFIIIDNEIYIFQPNINEIIENI